VALVVVAGVFALNVMGGDVTVKLILPIVAVIGLAILSFFLGVLFQTGGADPGRIDWNARIPEGMGFWAGFAIVFPAFTGNTMGIGLSGELGDPQREIPWGTKLATLISFVMYSLIAVFLAMGASPAELVGNRMIMADVSVWGPLVYTGLVVASLSSLIGSMVVAPRTLQAMSEDGILPVSRLFRSLWGGKREPLPALIFSTAIAAPLLFLADLEIIAGFVTMFFLITYMADCSASLLENVSNNPSYRPARRAPWWLSMVGVIMALVAAVNIDARIFGVSVLFLAASIWYARRRIPSPATQTIFTSVLFRLEREAALLLRSAQMAAKNWQPTVQAISLDPLDKRPVTKFLDWVGARHGMVHLCQMIPYLGDFTAQIAERERAVENLDLFIAARRSHLIPDVILTRDLSASILDRAQTGGHTANTLFFAVEDDSLAEAEMLSPIYHQLLAIRKNILMLRYGHRLFGNKREIYIWWSKPENGQLMVILSYILLSQRDWKDAHVTICYVADDENAWEQERYLKGLIESSRFQIGALRYRRFSFNEEKGIYRIIAEASRDADLVFLGLSETMEITEYMAQWTDLHTDALFVRSNGDADLSA